ncbi:hypothetical protein D3C76_1026400 [compost metagenome]
MRRNACQQSGFGTRGVVLGRFADGLEQLGTDCIVEIFGGQAFRRGRQAADDIPAKLTVVVVHRTRLARIPGQPQAGEHPALVRAEKVAIGRTGMARRGNTGAAAQHHRIDHELAVVFAHRAVRWSEARVGAVCALGPLPGHVINLLQQAGLSSGFPLGFSRQACIGPLGKRRGFVVADIGYRRGRVDGDQAAQRHLPPP